MFLVVTYLRIVGEFQLLEFRHCSLFFRKIPQAFYYPFLCIHAIGVKFTRFGTCMNQAPSRLSRVGVYFITLFPTVIPWYLSISINSIFTSYLMMQIAQLPSWCGVSLVLVFSISSNCFPFARWVPSHFLKTQVSVFANRSSMLSGSSIDANLILLLSNVHHRHDFLLFSASLPMAVFRGSYLPSSLHLMDRTSTVGGKLLR